ncbi:hypothetical protein D3C72_2421070 [compost metagenome]
MQAVQDDRFKLQTLGLVHGHDFNRAVILVRRIGRGEQARNAGVQRCRVDAAVRCEPLQQLEQAFGVVRHRQASVQRRAAQTPP